MIIPFLLQRIVSYLICILLFFNTISCIAQLQKVFVVDDTAKIFDTRLNPYYAFYIDAAGKQKVAEVSKHPFNISTSSIDSVSKQYKNKAARCWIRINIKNCIGKYTRMILCGSGTDGELVYIHQKRKYILMGNSDVFFTKQSKIERGLFPFMLDVNEEASLYICINNQYDKLYRTNYLQDVGNEGGYLLDTKGQINKHINSALFEDPNYNVKQYSFLSIIFFISLYTLIQYLINKKKSFYGILFIVFLSFVFSCIKPTREYIWIFPLDISPNSWHMRIILFGI